MPRNAKPTTNRGSGATSAKGRATPRSDRKRAAATATATEAAPTKRSATPARAAGGRFAAPDVRLCMTPPEVREVAGQPECILFGSDDHVEWQFGKRGVDPVGAPVLYVTALTFAAGRVIRITERMTEAP